LEEEEQHLEVEVDQHQEVEVEVEQHLEVEVEVELPAVHVKDDHIKNVRLSVNVREGTKPKT
jgi:hypothetical protein